ncbi:cupin domain-containing protein [Deinococcus psychrotolerans]|uniref:Cupin domain-containing protein n=1 Tax=Deinococcus psychrotolerans TaxID=2489213 RepID=A0A3G8YIU3_9DEIO|nr:cupin domain-containing protein [Deinococcus psychrotolerans]AZI42464.1 cupin domain-containing protein [Deinococcus psychrotolerans]
MIVHRAQHNQFIPSPNGNTGAALATPSLGAQEVSVVRQHQIPGGFNPVHTQDHEEVMVLLSGSVTISSGEERVALAAGDSLIVPPQTLHRVDNTGPTEAEWLIVSVAGVRLFREDGEEACPAWLK